MHRRPALNLVALACALVAAGPAGAAGGAVPDRGAAASGGQGGSLRVVLLGLRSDQRRLTRFVRRVSRPGSSRYGRYLRPRRLRHRFGASRSVRRKVLGFLGAADGIEQVELSSTGAVVLVVAQVAAAEELFCATGTRPPGKDVCVPRPLRRVVRQVSVGETYNPGPPARAATAGAAATERTGTPEGCEDGVNTGSFTPNQLDTAYGTHKLNRRGLKGQGMRVAILSSAFVEEPAFATWAGCFGLPTPRFAQTPMPGGTLDGSIEPDETYLDVAALSTVAPELRRITALFVPLDVSFENSFPLFLFGALDRGRQGGHLPDVLSISDGVCESEFTPDELRISERLLRAAAALGITAMAASGDLGFLGCNTGSGANYPASSRYVTGVGGTELTLRADNRIADQVVWTTFTDDPNQGGGSGGGPSSKYGRPGFQNAPGIRRSLQPGKPRRLTPDIASMGSFTPGIVTFGGGRGWTGGGGTSAATPLAAALVALVNQQEVAAGRPELGLLNPALYRFARGRQYDSIFSDVVKGTNSPQPNTPLGRSPAGGAAQTGYDLSSGLGSLRGSEFAAAVAAGR